MLAPEDMNKSGSIGSNWNQLYQALVSRCNVIELFNTNQLSPNLGGLQVIFKEFHCQESASDQVNNTIIWSLLLW